MGFLQAVSAKVGSRKPKPSRMGWDSRGHVDGLWAWLMRVRELPDSAVGIIWPYRGSKLHPVSKRCPAGVSEDVRQGIQEQEPRGAPGDELKSKRLAPWVYFLSSPRNSTVSLLHDTEHHTRGWSSPLSRMTGSTNQPMHGREALCPGLSFPPGFQPHKQPAQCHRISSSQP